MYQDTTMKILHMQSPSRWLCAVALLALAAGSLLAADATEPTAEGMMPSEQTFDPNQAEVDLSNGCFIKFIAFQKDSTIRDGLRLLAALCKKNIVPSSRVEGQLTISRLYNVTFEQALDAVLGHGFKYKQDGDFVRVYSAEEYKAIKEDPERMVHAVIPLHYITAEEAAKLVQPVLSAAAKIQTTTAAENSISGGSGGGLTAKGGGDDLALNDMIILFDYPENVEKAKAVIADVDTRPKQILVEATIMQVTLNEGQAFGIDWNFLSGLDVVDYIGSGYAGGNGTPVEAELSPLAPGGGGMTWAISAGNMRAVVTAIEQVTDSTILANPKILAVNKQEGAVLIGRKIGYINATTQTQTSTTQSVDFLETGTRLVFRPYICENGYIRMDIYPKNSSAQLNEVQVPNEDTVELRTNIIVKDGQTVVLGGLFRDEITTTKTQVPVLGDLPVVGAFFRGNTDEMVRNEVVIILTPHIIDEPTETAADKRVDDIRRKREAATDTLQWTSSARVAEEAYATAARYYLEGDLEKSLFNLKIALMMRPTYLEALRLRERIIAETDPEQYKRLDSIVTSQVEAQDTEKWMRR